MALGERLPFRPDGSVGATRVGAGGPTLNDLLSLIRRPGWMNDALCREYPQLTWFPEQGQSTGPAKAICARCKVTFECRKAGIDGEEVGVWGGLATGERRSLIAATRKDGRPPEEPAA